MKFAALFLLLAGCSLSPDRIEDQVHDCLKHEGFMPVIVIGKNQSVKRVICTVSEETGYTIIDRDFRLFNLPGLPSIPTLPELH